MRTTIAAVLLVLSSAAATAEATKADWDRLAEPVVAKFGSCAWTEVDRAWNTTAPAADIAGAAVAACKDKLEPLREILAKDPFGASNEEITATLEQIKGEVLDAAQTDIVKRRKE